MQVEPNFGIMSRNLYARGTSPTSAWYARGPNSWIIQRTEKVYDSHFGTLPMLTAPRHRVVATVCLLSLLSVNRVARNMDMTHLENLGPILKAINQITYYAE